VVICRWWRSSSPVYHTDRRHNRVYSTVGARHCVARVCLRQRRFVLTLIERAAHTQRDSPGGSTRRGQRIFLSEYYKDGHTYFGGANPSFSPLPTHPMSSLLLFPYLYSIIYSWRQKTRVPGLSRGVVCVTLRLAVLIQYRRVTDTHRQTHDDG